LVPRTAAPDRLATIVAAGTAVLGRVGYRRTRMADVAAAAGISSGGLFNYVETKDALFHVVLAHAFGEINIDDVQLPIAAPPFDQTLDLIERSLRNKLANNPLRAALKEDHPQDVRAELTQIIERFYRSMELLWPALAVIERSAIDLPQLEALYFGSGRKGFLSQLTRYCDRRIAAGYFRPQPDTAIAARFLNEAVVWFAWHRREDRDKDVYDDNAAIETVTKMLCDALIEPPR
jgi:AcrR family transcriptional regulator